MGNLLPVAHPAADDEPGKDDHAGGSDHPEQPGETVSIGFQHDRQQQADGDRAERVARDRVAELPTDSAERGGQLDRITRQDQHENDQRCGGNRQRDPFGRALEPVAQSPSGTS